MKKHGPIKAAISAVLISASAASLSETVCGTGANVSIPDGSGSATAGTAATVTITVPAQFTNDITDLTFDLEIDHTWTGDLIATLTSPSGTVVTLMDRPGVPASTFGCGNDDVDATFSDASGTAVETECASPAPAIAGTLNPTSSLSDFDLEEPAGNWTLTVTDNAGFDTGSIVQTGSCLNLTTVPVVLSSFSSKARGKRLITQWQTASEAFNLGFNVWGNIDNEWTQLNNRLLQSTAIDSVEPINYRRRFNLNKLPSPPTQIGISSLSSSGFEEFFGPFQIGEEYGEMTVPKPIDWSKQHEMHSAAMRKAGYEYRNNRWRKQTRGSKKTANRLKSLFADTWLRIEKDGVYRVTYEDLLAKGIDLKGLPVQRLALSHAGKPIARRIKGSSSSLRYFGPGAEIVFFAATPKGSEARYSNYTNIRISTEANLALNAPLSPIKNFDSGKAENIDVSTHLITETFGSPKGYSFIVPGDSPWYDEAVYAFGNNGIKSMNFHLDDDAILAKPVSIEINLMGGTSFDNIDVDGDGEVEPDHHYRVYLNRADFPDPIYEGFSEKVDAVLIEAETLGQIKHGENTLELEVIPDNGHNIDAAYFLSANLTYHTQNADQGLLNGFHLADDISRFSIISSGGDDSKVYLTDKTGNFSEVSTNLESDQVVIPLPTSFGESVERRIWMASSPAVRSPHAISPAPLIEHNDLNLEDIDYVVISDASLIGEDLQRFVEQQIDLGRRVKVINTRDIFARYSEGLESPKAIADYLRHAALGDSSVHPSPFKYVLLVGGHTYNYLGHNVDEDQHPINLIPSFYRNGEDTINRQIPTAVPFVDFDKDGTPDRAIGRWPVRDINQLKFVVDKTIAWHQQGSNKNNQQALLIAQKNEALHNFSQTLERVNTRIGHESNPWHDPTRVYVSDIVDDENIPADQIINEARSRFVDAMNQGPALTVYAGHASPTTWGRENLLTTSVVDQFANADAPSLIVPLACYTTYYETPNTKSLSERLFTDNAAGAVGLSGPALLSYNSENARFAKDLLQAMTQQGHDIGTATMQAKQAISGFGGRYQALIYNWVTLADPTLSFGLPPVQIELPSKDQIKETN